MSESSGIFTDTLANFTGGCLCQSVRFESTEPPYNTGFCHCRMCQKSLGNLFGTWVILKRDHLKFTEKEPKWYQSSDTVRRAFCGDCGSPILYDPTETDFVAVWIGVIDNPEDYEPRGHWHTEGKIGWVDIHDHLPVRS